MTTSVASNPERLTGYRMEQLAAAFDRVRHPRDWKAPIHAVIPAAERPVVEKAVIWFTDTVPQFEAAPGDADRLVVRAPGYRLGSAETRNGSQDTESVGYGGGEVDADPWGLRGPIAGR